ncbi:MAG: GNAT family N-acetyltransferase [Actinomycetota bacterium]|nr:GNAT family N-acetyltransferase [Actinomycetota bacterium]
MAAMEPLTVESTTDRATALAEAGPFLRSRPVENNLVLSLLAQRQSSTDGRYWWACRGDEVMGFAFNSPLSFRTVLSPLGPASAGTTDVVVALVDAMVEHAPELAGVASDAATAAAFAGRWAERRGVPAVPVEGQRIYRLGAVRHPSGVPGGLRPAAASDRDVLVAWATSFLGDTDSQGLDAADMTDRHLRAGRLWVWEHDGRPVSTAAASVPAAGVSRVAFVYTPPEDRLHGYATACVAALSARIVAGDAAICILYTQLSNPRSNAIYRRIGYEPVMEGLVYRFG